MSLKNCGCENTPDYDYSKLATTQPCVTQVAEDVDCVSHEGKFYDVTTEECVIPSVGKEFYIHLCQGNLWTKGVWIAVNLPNNKFAIFKITEAGNKRIKCLNGLDKSGDNGIVGNPEPGTTIASGSIFYPVVPAGSTSDFTTKIINAIENYGVDTVINMLKESNSICFTNTPEISDEDGDVHLFGGTKPECDCSEGASVFSCFRKLLNIITGQSGKTLCMPNVSITSGEDVDGGQQKRMAVFDENGCLKKYKRLADPESCTDSSAVTDSKFGALIVCQDGEKKVLAAQKDKMLVAVPTDQSLPDGDYSWKLMDSGLLFFPITPVTLATAVGTTSPSLSEFPHANCYGVFSIQWNIGSLITLVVKIDSETTYSISSPDTGTGLDHICIPIKLATSNPSLIITGGGSGSFKHIGYFAKYK